MEGTYRDGTVSVGLSGDAALLVGIKLDVRVEIDVGEVTDTATPVADFFGNDVSNFIAEHWANTAMVAANAARAAEDATENAARAAEDAIRNVVNSVADFVSGI